LLFFNLLFVSVRENANSSFYFHAGTAVGVTRITSDAERDVTRGVRLTGTAATAGGTVAGGASTTCTTQSFVTLTLRSSLIRRNICLHILASSKGFPVLVWDDRHEVKQGGVFAA
jgi:hypothetical protein